MNLPTPSYVKPHCGSWIAHRPGQDACWISRLVCTLPRGHAGQHFNRFYIKKWDA